MLVQDSARRAASVHPSLWQPHDIKSERQNSNMVDALQRPFLRISPEFGTYAEEHGIFELFGTMLKELLIARPENPLEFFVKLLTKPIIDGMQ